MGWVFIMIGLIFCLLSTFAVSDEFQSDLRKDKNLLINKNNININISVREDILKLPLRYIENRGQYSNEVKSMVKDTGQKEFFLPSEVVPALDANDSSNKSSNSLTISSTSVPDEEWNSTFGGKYLDSCTSVWQTNNGGYILAGYTASYGMGGYDFWLLKTDERGNEFWNKTYGGSRDEVCTSSYQTRDGGYILAGYTNSYSAGGRDFWLVKTDASGNELWNRTVGKLSDEFCYSIEQTSDGGYILAGAFVSGGYNFWLVKTDENGYKLWDRILGSISCNSVQQTSDGGYILAGSSYLNNYNFRLVKTDASGNVLWDRNFGGPLVEFCNSVQQTSDGGYILGGIRSTSYSEGYDYSWLVKTDANGIEQWNKTVGEFGNYSCNSVRQTREGGYIIVGDNGANNIDSWLAKTDASGSELWNKTFGIQWWYDGLNSVQQTSDGGYIIAGDLHNPYSSSGWIDSWLVKISADVPQDNAPIDVCRQGCSFSTIQAAVDAANPGDTINIAEGTYKEEVHIYKSLTIRGAGAGKTIVDGNQDGTVFIIDPGIDVTLSGMAIQNGLASLSGGGGIFNRGRLTISDVTITGNSAGASGGGAGIYNAGPLTMNSGTVSGNSITTETFGYGIGVYNSGTFTMNGGTISENSASGTNQHGGGVYNVGTFFMNGGTISGNSITGTNCYGGGVFNYGDGTFTMNGGIISGNYADYGGGIANSGSLFIGGTSQIKDNQATTSYGGGIESDNSQVTFEGKNVAVKSNQARLPFPSELSWHQGWGVYVGSGMPTTTGGFDPGTQVTDNTLITSNHRPNKPSAPTGSAISVKYYAGPAYAFSTSTTDPDGDQVKYIFEWGDGRVPTTSDMAVSGAVASKSHTWDNAGSYQVKVKAIDSHGAFSEWSDPLTVTINNPVILIYGIFGEVDSLNPIAYELIKEGIVSLKFDFAPDGKETACGDIRSYARQLDGFIEEQKKTNKIKKFDIVAHSMGGLISRWYIEKMSGTDHIDKLIMLGTPNHGSYLCDTPGIYLNDLAGQSTFGGYRPPLYYIIYGIKTKNVLHVPPAAEDMKHNSYFLDSLGYDGRTNYHIIAGTKPHSLEMKLGSEAIRDEQVGRGLQPTLNDGAVAVEDVSLKNAASTDYFEIDHLEELSLKQDGDDFSDEIDKIIYILEGSSSQSATKENSIFSNAANETPVQSLPTIEDTIYPSDEKYHDINISFAQYAQIYLLGQEGNLSLNLTTPSGKPINKSVLQDGVTYLEESSNSIAKGYEIENPETGTWEAYVKAMNVSSSGDNYTILTYIGTNLTLSILPAKYHLNPNEPIEISANLTNDSLPVAGANLVAYYVKPDLSIEHQILYDDGLHNDSLSNDGIYASTFKNTSLRGTYQISVTANGSLNGIDFMRLGSISVWAELYPDLTINPFDISFSNPSPMPNEEVKLNATIRNVGNISANNASILFFAGSPVLENLIGQAAINVSADETMEANTTWNAEPGLHQISVWVSPCNEFLESNYSNNMASRIISVESPPTLNIPSGPTSGIPGTSYSYSTFAIDPDGDQIAYTFDWGDGTNSTTALFDSGAIANASHAWNIAGIYAVKAKATDSNGLDSEWSNAINVSIANNSCISGTKFNDTNSNATRDPGEAGLPGWTIRLTRPDGTTINATTDASGAYKFENLTSGTYRVSEIRQSNWTQTYPAWLGDHIINVTDGNVTGVDFGNNYLPVPEIPFPPSGPASGIPGAQYSYSTSSTDPSGYQIAYTFDWGDGSNTTTGLFDSGAVASAAHIWNSSGVYQVRAMATNSKGASSGWSDALEVDIAAGIIPDQIGVFRNGGLYFDANGDRYWTAGDTTGWFGTTGDLPVAGDWDGDGKDEIAVFRNGGWYFDANGDGYWSTGDATGWFGATGDMPAAGDWDGDGKDEIAVFRNGGWYFDANGDGYWTTGDTTGWFGATGDLPAAGDWDGDGKDEIAVFRNGGWYFDANGDRYWTTGDTTGWFGATGDLPAAGDWDGDGKDEIAVFRNGGWYFDANGDRYWTTGDTTGWFGAGGDRPVAGRWRSPLSSSVMDNDRPQLDLDQKVEPSEKIRQKRAALKDLEEESRDQVREIKISQKARQ